MFLDASLFCAGHQKKQQSDFGTYDSAPKREHQKNLGCRAGAAPGPTTTPRRPCAAFLLQQGRAERGAVAAVPAE